MKRLIVSFWRWLFRQYLEIDVKNVEIKLLALELLLIDQRLVSWTRHPLLALGKG